MKYCKVEELFMKINSINPYLVYINKAESTISKRHTFNLCMIKMHVKDLQVLMVGNRSQVSSDGTAGTQVKRGEFGGGMVANRVLWLRSCFLHLALSTVYWLANSCSLPCQRLCNPLPLTLNQSDSLVGRISSSTKNYRLLHK